MKQNLLCRTKKSHLATCLILSLPLIASISSSLNARPALERGRLRLKSTSEIIPAYCSAQHNIGRMTLIVTNDGIIGGGAIGGVDCFTGEEISLSCEFPKGSGLEHLYGGALWLGAVVYGDTLVSTGMDGWRGFGGEIAPDPSPAGDMFYRSTLDPTAPEFEGAISEQDYIAVYTDTLIRTSRDYFQQRPHRPLYVNIRQNSYAWSYKYAEDFVLFDFNIENIGQYVLNDFYLGLYVDADIGFKEGIDYWDDVCGFLKTYPSFQGCGFEDTVNTAWIADNDGDPYKGEFIDHAVMEGDRVFKSVRSVTGVRILEPPSEFMSLSFNWWISNTDGRYDFGPRHRENFRDFRTGGLGTPEGDVNKYHILSNGEFDYDQAYTANVWELDTLWLYPDQALAADYADGYDTRYVLSYGPFTIEPGADVSIAFAYVAGENLHTDVNNLRNLPNDPDAFYDNLNFSDLAKNGTWAQWIYDNPGVDTDDDGYFGKYRVCSFESTMTDSGWVLTQADTFWYEGDGIPDWRAAGPPPAPYFWVKPLASGLRIRFNGSRSETEKDYMSGIVDFEGYHVWLGRDDRAQSYSLLCSYDLENFDKFVWNERAQPYPNFELFEKPFTLEQLRCLYGSGPYPCSDPEFDPYQTTRSDPYVHPLFADSIFWFVPHNLNSSRLEGVGNIHKVYPDEPPPPQGVHPDSLNPDRYTEEGYLKYYEYEFIIENLLPTVPYWVNVTAFDFGSPESGVSPLETSKTIGASSAFPLMEDNRLNGNDLRAYVYPNPYRIDGDYRRHGFEGRTEEIMPDDKVRAIHFANLPPRCTIRIYSIDGDLVRQFYHDVDPSDPNYLHDEWDMITRNRQAVVSGLYFWTVEDDAGNVQIGKLVIIM